MNTFEIASGSRRGEYLLRGQDGRSLGTLRAGWTLRRGKINTEGGSFAIQRHGWQQVEVVAGGACLVAFGPDQITVPGPGPQPTWNTSREPGGWHGSLRRGGEAIDVWLEPPGARRGQVSVTGDWQQLDLIVLAACFALVLRRRRRVVIATAGAH